MLYRQCAQTPKINTRRSPCPRKTPIYGASLTTTKSQRSKQPLLDRPAAGPFGRDFSGMDDAEVIMQEEIEEGAAVPAPAAAPHPAPQVVKAVKKNDWALRSVLKGTNGRPGSRNCTYRLLVVRDPAAASTCTS